MDDKVYPTNMVRRKEEISETEQIEQLINRIQMRITNVLATTAEINNKLLDAKEDLTGDRNPQEPPAIGWFNVTISTLVSIEKRLLFLHERLLKLAKAVLSNK
mgnify:CR=1 FL=1